MSMQTPLKIAIPTAPLRQPLRQALLTASSWKVQGVQLDVRTEVKGETFGATAIRQLKGYLRELKLSLGTVVLPTRKPLTDPEHLDARLNAVRTAMEFAQQLGASALCVRLGAIPGDVDSPAYQTMREILSDLAGYGNRVGAQLALSIGGTATTHARRLLGEVKTGPMGIDFDPASSIFAGRNPAQEVRELHGVLSHLQIRDGYRDEEGTGTETAIGAGEVTWDELLATLIEMEYPGWSTVRRTGGDSIVDDLERGATFAQNVLLY